MCARVCERDKRVCERDPRCVCERESERDGACVRESHVCLCVWREGERREKEMSEHREHVSTEAPQIKTATGKRKNTRACMLTQN